MKKLVILQSNYIPWKGYFDLMASADEFMILDDVQYTKNDWRNRNQILSPIAKSWLTIPVGFKFSERPLISEIQISDSNWINTHLSTLERTYLTAPYFGETFSWISSIYRDLEGEQSLSAVNLKLLTAIADRLKIKTRISSCRDYILPNDSAKMTKDFRVLELCKKANASVYITGPKAMCYLNPLDFKENNIQLLSANYRSYSAYPQFSEPCDHAVTILDMFFHLGERTLDLYRTENLLEEVNIS